MTSTSSVLEPWASLRPQIAGPRYLAPDIGPKYLGPKEAHGSKALLVDVTARLQSVRWPVQFSLVIGTENETKQTECLCFFFWGLFFGRVFNE